MLYRQTKSTTVTVKAAQAAVHNFFYPTRQKNSNKKMSSRDLEKEYDATQWSQRITDPVELLQAHDDYSNTGDKFTRKFA